MYRVDFRTKAQWHGPSAKPIERLMSVERAGQTHPFLHRAAQCAVVKR